jgi:SagB-type dehydrogenase family enzyme
MVAAARSSSRAGASGTRQRRSQARAKAGAPGLLAETPEVIAGATGAGERDLDPVLHGAAEGRLELRRGERDRGVRQAAAGRQPREASMSMPSPMDTARIQIVTSARRYHQATKHFPARPSSSPWGLEWRNEPDLFKRYPGIRPEPPPEKLARFLRLGAGVHPRRGDPHFRTFMSAGALHPVELYLATQLGLAHFHPGEGSIRRLRSEDVRTVLARAAVAPELAEAAAVLVLTGIVWRTAWKYGARGWRHVFWDAGAMLANLLALADEGGLAPRVFVAFTDAEVARVLGVEPPREAPVALLALGDGRPALPPGALPSLRHEVLPVSVREHRFPQAEEAESASELATAEEVRTWREAAARLEDRRDGGDPPAHLGRVILRRGSARDFTLDSIHRDGLAAALRWARGEVQGDLPPLCSTFVIAHAVEGLRPAAYRVDPPDHFEPVREDASRTDTAHLCLDQPLGGRAAATTFFTADLDRVLPTLGDRGYRAAQLDAGISAGRLSLGAYARGLGATGLTFYDDEVRGSLRTAHEPMMCVAVGADARRPLLRRQRPSES